jgi:protein TonB
VLSVVVQVAVVAAAVVTSMADTESLPEVHPMPAFVAQPPAPPPTPPPPKATPERRPPTRPKRPATQTPRAIEQVIERQDVTPTDEPRVDALQAEEDFSEFTKGIESGLPGGSSYGVAGGLPGPVPPPPVAAVTGPIRVGGRIEAPALAYRVDPVYPELAAAARLQGIVILEALVNRDGRIDNVKVLRSSGTTLLDRAAEDAVHQWRYEPLLLNGVPTRFLLTVTLSFHLDRGS